MALIGQLKLYYFGAVVVSFLVVDVSVDGLLIVDEVSLVILLESLDVLFIVEALSACGSVLPVAVDVVSHDAKPITSIAKKMILFIMNYLINKIGKIYKYFHLFNIPAKPDNPTFY